MTKTVPFEILCKSILFIDFCTVLHIEEKKNRLQLLSSTSQMQVLSLLSQFKGNDTAD